MAYMINDASIYEAFDVTGTYRSFAKLRPTYMVQAFQCEKAYPAWVSQWLVRIVYEDSKYRPESPIIEFYSIDTMQFVSSYYLDTLAEHTPGYTLALWGDVEAWRISWADLKDILQWCENVLE